MAALLIAATGAICAAALQAQAPLICNGRCPAILGAPEEHEEVDEFWIEPARTYVMPRPAFGDVIAVQLQIPRDHCDRPDLDAMQVPSPIERVSAADPMRISGCSACFGEPGSSCGQPASGSLQPYTRSAWTSASKPQAPVSNALFVVPADQRRREEQKQIVLAQWSTPLLTPAVTPSPPAERRTILYRTYNILMWPILRVTAVLHPREDYRHIYPTGY